MLDRLGIVIEELEAAKQPVGSCSVGIWHEIEPGGYGRLVLPTRLLEVLSRNKLDFQVLSFPQEY
ncbi:MAG: hypothetical protein NXI12_10720 [Alphaproteobacteria bacterium]|nr:hypothetical protein [Alphaproteobacteria bacterium]